MADLSFSSYVQGPLGEAIRTEETFGSLPAPTFAPTVQLTGPGPQTQPIAGPPMRLLGPGHVAALVAGSIRRQEPTAGAADVEPNYLAAAEVQPVELPWVLTPARPAAGRLRPWFVLVVLEKSTAPLTPGDPLPTVNAEIAQLPDLRDSWGWAHVQRTTGAGTLPGGGAAPVAAVARLVCPRRLRPGLTYRACLVPAFASGVAAGLGAPGAADLEHALAWDVSAGGSVLLPVYHQWEFSTGPSGDFEELVTRLRPADPEQLRIGSARSVDVRQPWPDDDALADSAQVVAVQGALRPFTDPPVPDAAVGAEVGAALDRRLRAELDAPADRLDHGSPEDSTGSLAPPLYGGRHVSRDRVGDDPAWLAQLNASVANRIAAGLGADYIRAHQEDLMAKAWEQVGAIREANRLRAVVELTTEVADRMHARHVATLEPAELVALAAPAAVRMRTSPSSTFAMEARMSRMTDAAGSTAFVRAVRPAGKLARRSGVTVRTVLPRALVGDVSVPAAAPVIPATARLDAQAINGVLSAAAARQLIAMSAMVTVAHVNDVGGREPISAGIDGLGLSGEVLQSIRAGDRFTVARGISAEVDAVTQVARDLTAALPLANDDRATVSAFGVPIEAAALAGRIAEALRPADSRRSRLGSRVVVPDRLQPATVADRVLASPSFPVPTALALLGSDPEWFLPGLGALPTNRVALLQQNAPFIESFLVGINHEMMRELLWREYPTDRRGTPFASFWPRPSGQPDIPRLHTWGGPVDLGRHLLEADGLAVLLVRGDVLHRYPGMVVTAVRSAPPDDAGRFRPDPAQPPVLPTFAITVDDATTAYAFEIPTTELVAAASAEAPGWFFVFAEQGFRLRFGFDEPPEPGAELAAFTSWNDASWPGEGAEPNYAPVAREHAVAGLPFPAAATEPTDARWNRDAADIARIALQRPFRVAIQAGVLIRPDSAG